MVTRGPDVVWRAVDQLLVVGRPDGTVLTVTGPGSDVWQLLDTGASVDQIVAELSERYRRTRRGGRRRRRRVARRPAGAGVRRRCVEHPALVAAARVGLPVGAGALLAHIGDDDLSDVLAVARMDRLGGMLSVAIDDGAVTVDPAGAEEIRELFHAQLVTAVAAEALAVRVADILSDAHTEWRLTRAP